MKTKKYLLKSICIAICINAISCNTISVMAEECEYVENYDMDLQFSYGERSGTYSGHIKNGLPDGIGKFESCSSSGEPWTYIGEWKEGHFDGIGVTFFDSKQIDLGEYSNDSLNGEGGLVVPESKQIYIGDMVNGVPEGVGTFWSSDCVYTGEYLNGSPNGTGRKEFRSGKSFEGTFLNDQISGNGIFSFDNGDYIEGEFSQNEDGTINGSGVYYYLNGEHSDCIIVNDIVQFTTVQNETEETDASLKANEDSLETETNSTGETKSIIQFRDFEWNASYTSAKEKLTDYRINKISGEGYKTYPVDYVLSGKGGIEFENSGINIISSIHGDINVAGYVPDSMSMYYAYIPGENGEYDWSEDNSALYGAEYEIDATEGLPIFEDLLAKLTSIYGEPVNREETEGWAGAKFTYLYWNGDNDTELCLRMCNYTTSSQSYQNPYEIYIAYAWRGGDRLLQDADAAMHQKKVSDESNKIQANAGNISGL